MKDSQVFAICALMIWVAICLPGNIVTIVLLLRQSAASATSDADSEPEITTVSASISTPVPSVPSNAVKNSVAVAEADLDSVIFSDQNNNQSESRNSAVPMGLPFDVNSSFTGKSIIPLYYRISQVFFITVIFQVVKLHQA